MSGQADALHVATWADSYGLWHARVLLSRAGPNARRTAAALARRAVLAELQERGEGTVFRLQLQELAHVGDLHAFHYRERS